MGFLTAASSLHVPKFHKRPATSPEVSTGSLNYSRFLESPAGDHFDHRMCAPVGVLDSRGLVKLKLSLAIDDYDAALKLNPKQASSLYGRGIAKLRSGSSAAGNSDIAAAKAINPASPTSLAAMGFDDGRWLTKSDAKAGSRFVVEAAKRSE